jgi:hypothetical protein
VIRLQAEISIENDDALVYHGETLTPERLADLIADLIYENTNAYASDIKVLVTRMDTAEEGRN